MTSDWLILVLFVLGTLTVSFLCSMWEAALYAVAPSKVESLKESGTSNGKKLFELRKNIDEPIAAILVLNTISHTVGATGAGAKAADIALNSGMPISKSMMVGLASVVFTLLILFVSEIIPKTLGVVYADTLAPIFAYPIQWTIWGLYPIVRICQSLTRMISPAKKQGEVTEEDLLTMAQSGAQKGTLLQEEAQWVSNILALDDTYAKDIMTPRTVMFILDSDAQIEEYRDEAPEWIYSRIPIAPGKNPDEIEGIVMRREVLEELAEGETDQALRSLKREVQFVKENVPLHSLLKKYIKSREHLFLVRDKFGGVSGLVTLEDVFEEIIGREIMDETDRHADLQSLARLLYESEARSAEENREAQIPSAESSSGETAADEESRKPSSNEEPDSAPDKQAQPEEDSEPSADDASTDAESSKPTELAGDTEEDSGDRASSPDPLGT